VELIGARQAQLVLSQAATSTAVSGETIIVRARPQPLAPRLSAEERAAHLAFVATLGEGAIWRDYLSLDSAGSIPARSARRSCAVDRAPRNRSD
jgi:DNA polymerase III subunit epsilon